MPRELPFTSLQAYERISAAGMLPPARYKVYDLLFRTGPLTGREVDEALTPDAHKRLPELEAQGVVKRVGTKLCPHTGQEGYLWDITDQMPMSLKKNAGAANLQGDAKAIAEIKAAIPEKKRSTELHNLLARLEASAYEVPGPDPGDHL